MKLADDEDLRAALALIQRRLSGEVPAVTVGDLWTPYWLTEGKHRDSAADIKGRWMLYLRPFFSRVPALSVTKEMCETYRTKRAEKTTRRGRAPTAATVNRELAVLRRILNWAAEERKISHNPISKLRMEKESEPRKSRIGSEAQVNQFLEHASPLLRAVFLVLYDCGIRKRECLGLRWDQLDETARGAQIIAKGRKPRRIRFTPRAWEALQIMPKIGPHVFANCRVYSNGRRSCFYGRPYADRYIYRLFQECIKESGLEGANGENIVLHTLRHSFVYVNRFKRRIPEIVIQRAGGWKTDAAFKRYGDVDDEELDDFYDRVAGSIEHEQSLAHPRQPPKAVDVTIPTRAHDSRKIFKKTP